ncbi:hypothetical protein JI75_02410 [Berryella intestinalis]|uniref:Uncharacterized protein n=1 Tax=Berryella intestinalis TaxID=1531429 RepID=A0A0A8B2H9_9ACTN|nr:hypothetical protein [Berryella intestinalis]AJC11696.1 hypothetical protein JI75_02410 [Berryella intestinalis]
MDRVPGYLIVYLLRIRRHSNEDGYLEKRAGSLSVDQAVYERSMLHEMQELHLIAYPDPKEIAIEDGDGLSWVPFPPEFILLARGKYLFTEIIADSLKWVAASALGAAIALVVSKLG